MSQRKRVLIGAVATLTVMGCVSMLIGYHKHVYPYGRKPAGISLPGLYGSLLAYAAAHKGWFPESGNDPFVALQLLYSEYCPTGRELAGVSGDVQKVVTALQKGEKLDSTLTSWVYVPGLRRDDPRDIAIVWESEPGLNMPVASWINDTEGV